MKMEKIREMFQTDYFIPIKYLNWYFLKDQDFKYLNIFA